MGEFIKDFIVFLFCFFTMEYCLYIKDYSEIVAINEYIYEDIKEGNLKEIYNGKYNVKIYLKEEQVCYVIKASRKSLLNVKVTKTIKYHGIVS